MKHPLFHVITFAFFIIEITFNIASAQEKLEGYILNKVTNQPIAFAHLRILGNEKVATVSNEEGFFRLESNEIKAADTLIITHIIYSPYALSLQAFRAQDNSKIMLEENIIELNEVKVKPTEDYESFEAVVTQTKKDLYFPMTAKLYYRELVKENKSYNKFADALLTVVYDQKQDENDLKIKVDQCRTVKLPKDDEDQFEMISPVKMEWVLGHVFGNFLNRFRKEKQNNYHYYFFRNSYLNENTLIIEPKKEASRANNATLYTAIIKTDNNNSIRDIQLELDSTCQVEKSFLGITFSIIHSKVLLSFKKTGDVNYLAFARLNFTMDVYNKKFKQTEDFVSEFITLEVKPEAKEIEKTALYKKSSLYKHPNSYETAFWKGLNLPVPSKEEEKLMLELENGRKVKGK